MHISATITVNFAGGTAANTNVNINLANCKIAPGPSNGVSLAMASAITNISVSSGAISIATATNAQFNGSCALAISWTSDATPTVTLNNLKNPQSPATVTWPTANTPETQILTPGVPVQLSGIVST